MITAWLSCYTNQQNAVVHIVSYSLKKYFFETLKLLPNAHNKCHIVLSFVKVLAYYYYLFIYSSSYHYRFAL